MSRSSARVSSSSRIPGATRHSGAGRRSPLAYAPPAPGSPALLQRAGARAAFAYLGALTLTAFLYSSPLILLAVGVAIVIAGLASSAGPALAFMARLAIPLAAVMVVVNVLVSHRGDTVLIRGFDAPVVGPLDVTLESLAAGGAIALRVVVVMGAFAVFSACINPDAILRLVRPFARRSAMTATLIARLVPLAAGDYARLREAAELRGPGAVAVTRAALARRLVAGALDRSLDAAAALELRGYSLPGRAAAATRGRHRQAPAVFAAASAIAAVAIAARFGELGGFGAYPSVELDLGPGDLGLALTLPVIAAAPLLGARRSGRRARRSAALAGGAGG